MYIHYSTSVLLVGLFSRDIGFETVPPHRERKYLTIRGCQEEGCHSYALIFKW